MPRYVPWAGLWPVRTCAYRLLDRPKRRTIRFQPWVAAIVIWSPGIARAQKGFAFYGAVLESFSVRSRISPDEEARRYVRKQVEFGKIPKADAERAIAEMAASIARSHAPMTLRGETVGGRQSGVLYYRTFLPFSSPGKVEATPAWEMLRDGVTYQKSHLGSLQLTAEDDLRFLGSAGMRWMFTGAVPPTTPPIRPQDAGRSVHRAVTRPLNELEKGQNLSPLLETIEIVWRDDKPERILVSRGYGCVGLAFRIRVDEWRAGRPVRFVVEEMERDRVLRRRTHTLRGITQELPRPLDALGATDAVLDYRLSPEHPYSYAWVGHIMPLDLLRRQITERDAAIATSRYLGGRSFAILGAGGALIVAGFLLLLRRKR